MQKLKSKLQQRIDVDPDCLRWTPLISTQLLLEEEKRAEKEVSNFLLNYTLYMYFFFLIFFSYPGTYLLYKNVNLFIHWKLRKAENLFCNV